MIWALKVHHLKPDWLSAEMSFVPEEDIYLSLADWRSGKARNYDMENSPAGLKMSLLDPQLLHGIFVQNVDATAAIYQNSGKLSSSPISGKGGIQN